VEQIVEAGDDAEVAAAAADRPEQIRMRPCVDLQDATVGCHDLGPEQVVDRQSVLAHEKACAAAERESADPHRGRVAETGCETVRCGGSRDLARGEPARCVGDTVHGIDPERAEAGQVEHDPAVARPVTCRAVPAAADRQLDPAVTGQRDDVRDVRSARGPHDGGRPPVDGRQEHAARDVVCGVTGADNRSRQLGAELRYREAGVS
jgi:hypothetical protein